MKGLKAVLVTALVGVGAALTYFYFESAVHHSINYIWNDLFNTEAYRILVVPVCMVITVAYFGVQHLLDPKSEQHESHGLGSVPKPAISNYLKVLGIGFLSLVAGASMGPEAILVPACIIVGSYIGSKLEKDGTNSIKIYGMAGFIGLFAAFFNSFFAGLLSLLLIKKELKLDINIRTIVFASVAAASTVLTLDILDSSPFVPNPAYSWKLNPATLLALALLFFGGYLVAHALSAAHNNSERITKLALKREWWIRGVAAGAGLSLLYLLGGSLTQFTGNEAIMPMLQKSAELGFLGLLWLLIVKILAIGWSKAAGYRGGLIFPTVFAASILVAMARLYVDDLNLLYGLIAAMVGVFYAEAKVKILL
jgi:H+/Cl- antiporter ClcA